MHLLQGPELGHYLLNTKWKREEEEKITAPRGNRTPVVGQPLQPVSLSRVISIDLISRKLSKEAAHFLLVLWYHPHASSLALGLALLLYDM